MEDYLSYFREYVVLRGELNTFQASIASGCRLGEANGERLVDIDLNRVFRAELQRPNTATSRIAEEDLVESTRVPEHGVGYVYTNFFHRLECADAA